tara:strand:+ start:454 stop:1086 length:633 start_codon:yes stop_codon:yes gene_type:complete
MNTLDDAITLIEKEFLNLSKDQKFKLRGFFGILEGEAEKTLKQIEKKRKQTETFYKRRCKLFLGEWTYNKKYIHSNKPPAKGATTVEEMGPWLGRYRFCVPKEYAAIPDIVIQHFGASIELGADAKEFEPKVKATDEQLAEIDRLDDLDNLYEERRAGNYKGEFWYPNRKWDDHTDDVRLWFGIGHKFGGGNKFLTDNNLYIETRYHRLR